MECRFVRMDDILYGRTYMAVLGATGSVVYGENTFSKFNLDTAFGRVHKSLTSNRFMGP